MTGSAFITHNGTWSCSNEVVLGIYTDPVMVDGKVVSIREERTLTIYGIFHATEPPKIGDTCEMVMLNSELNEKYSFVGEVKAIGEIHTIINNLFKIDKVSEILSNITFKN